MFFQYIRKIENITEERLMNIQKIQIFNTLQLQNERNVLKLAQKVVTNDLKLQASFYFFQRRIS